MGWQQKRSLSLRGLLLLLLLPASGFPLLVFGFFSVFWIEKALEKDLKNKIGPEIAAFQNIFDQVERRLSLNLDSFASLHFSRDQNVTEKTVFDQIVFYKKSGDFLKQIQSPRNAERIFENSPESDLWKTIIPRGKPSTLSSTRSPSSSWDAELNEFSFSKDRLVEPKNEVLGRRLKDGFRKILARGPHFSVLQARGSDLEFVVGRALKGAEGQILGFALGRVHLDKQILGIISVSLGREFALHKAQENFWLTTSTEKLWAFKASLPKEPTLQSPKAISLESKSGDKRPLHFAWFDWQRSDLRDPIYVGLELGQGGFAELGERVQGGLVFLCLALFLGSIFLAVILSKALARPLQQLLNATEKIRSGFAPDTVSSQGWVREFDQLVEQFNEMAHTVEVGKKSLKEKIDQLGQINKELHETQDQLVHSAKMSSIGQLVAGVAHELNNPIAFIYSNMTQLKEYSLAIHRMDEEIRNLQKSLSAPELKKFLSEKEKLEWDYVVQDIGEIANSCLEGSVRVKDIVLGLKSFSRAGGDFKESIPIKNLIDSTLKLMGKIPSKIKIKINVESSLLILGNSSQLGQVIMNLVNNAVHACGSQGGEVEISAQATVLGSGNHGVQLRVSDNGMGISKENLEKIFDPFFSTKKVGEGTGLGLSIVYGIVQKHGGKIRVESRVGQPGKPGGTVFILDFPAAEAAKIAS